MENWIRCKWQTRPLKKVVTHEGRLDYDSYSPEDNDLVVVLDSKTGKFSKVPLATIEVTDARFRETEEGPSSSIF